MKIDLEERIEVPKEVKIILNENGFITAKGPKGEVSRKLFHPKVQISLQGNELVVGSKKATRKEKTMIGSFTAHLKNMIKGVLEPYIYKLKICTSHFPVNISMKGSQFVVNNFLGEKIPRVMTLKKGVNVKVEGSDVIVESVDKELAGQTAASIEELCRTVRWDKRVFQDGIFITSKAGKEIK